MNKIEEIIKHEKDFKEQLDRLKGNKAKCKN